MNYINHVPNNKSTNQSYKAISSSTKKSYKARLKRLASTDYTNIEKLVNS